MTGEDAGPRETPDTPEWMRTGVGYEYRELKLRYAEAHIRGTGYRVGLSDGEDSAIRDGLRRTSLALDAFVLALLEREAAAYRRGLLRAAEIADAFDAKALTFSEWSFATEHIAALIRAEAESPPAPST